jgi:N-carbamoylputrescine amidase
LKITVCQMNDDRKLFARDWFLLVEHVKREMSEMVLLPEMPFSSWFCATAKFDPDVWKEAVAQHERWEKHLSDLGSDVVLATRPINKGSRRLNEGYVWTKEHGAKGVQFKNYLPNESGYFEASWYGRGDRVFSPFDVAKCKVGFMICSDIWSMQHARAYGKQGVHLLAVPTAHPKASVDKWVAGGKVAAVVSGAFCISSNRVGQVGEANFGGCGWIIGPDAHVLGLTSGEKPFFTAEVDLKEAERAKNTYPRDALEPD